MRKNLIYFTSIAIIFYLVSCSNESLLPDNKPDSARTISLTASMPSENPTTRVDLTEKADKSIALTWEVGDQLELAFVQGETKIKDIVTVKNISPDGKKAQFDIIVPAGIQTETFDLYGVYGGGGLSAVNPSLVNLPTNAGSAGSLISVKGRKDVMLYFASKNMQTAAPQASVVFKHLGSLFNITLKNISTNSYNNLGEVRLVGPEGGNWAFNSGAGGGVYDLVSGEFQNTASAGNYISFKAENSELSNGGSVTFWGWYPPLPGEVWPQLKLQVVDTDGNIVYTSDNSKKTRTDVTDVGKSYYFYAVWNGSTLVFTDQSYTFPPLEELVQIPHLYIETDGNVGITSKDNYVKGNLRIVGGDKYGNYEGRTSIKGRGNTTWEKPKKPYRLKLDTKASLLGLSPEKDWILLANSIDPSLMCNAVAMKTGQLLQMPFTNHIIPVDVTVNGEYLGNYTFTEHKEVENNRINVGEGGWLFEMDTYYDEVWKFKSNVIQLPVMIQYPELVDMTEVVALPIFNEMKNDFNAMEGLIVDETFPNNNYLDYFDATAFVNYIIVYTLTDNEEINHPKSTYIYKKKGGKYNMGPIWDFDWAFGYEGTNIHFVNPNRSLIWSGDKSGSLFFSRIIQDPFIQNLYKTEWGKFKQQKYPLLVEYIKEYAETIRESHATDQQRWGNSSGSIDEYKTKMLNWLDARVIYMDNLTAGY
ncbi:MAG: CotH kinase family protein [Candidatus Saccharimonadaceae bacterium]